MVCMEPSKPGTISRGASQWLRQPAMVYPDAYAWFVLVSALDIMLTWCVLTGGGVELNYLADRVIYVWGMHGLVVYKFCLVVFVIIMCENIGRRRPATGRGLSLTAVGLTCVPVFFSIGQLLGVMHLG